VSAEPFPYEYREYQKEFIEYVRSNIKEKNLVINAITGFGKTPLILSSILPQAIEEKRKIIWAVKTGNEIDRPIEELKTITDITDTKAFGISFRGKRDMCLLLNDLKIKGIIGYDDAKYICEIYKDRCKYYSNLVNKEGEHFLTPKFYSEILTECMGMKVCPYYLQLKLLPLSTVVALSYNYILDEGVRWVVQNGLDLKNAYLVVDEAHNLQQVSISLNSDHISELGILMALKEVRDFKIRSRIITNFLKIILSQIREESRNIDEDKEFNFKDFIGKTWGKEVLKIAGLLIKAGLQVRETRFENNQVPRSSLFHIGEFLARVCDSHDVEGIVFIVSRDFKEKTKLELVDMRTSEVLSEVWNLTYRNLFCSGTLNPIDDFAKVIGLNNYVGRTFPSIFDSRNAFSMITSYLTTEGIDFK